MTTNVVASRISVQSHVDRLLVLRAVMKSVFSNVCSTDPVQSLELQLKLLFECVLFIFSNTYDLRHPDTCFSQESD